MKTYYNDNDEFCVDLLRELIRRGKLPAGEVDSRSIKDVQPDDLRGFDQCHFFAGIGGWAYAIGAAGWPDDREIWSASCPCQPFSEAGERRGFDDPRHLLPDLLRLARARRPAVIVGEQVAEAAGLLWFDEARTSLAREGYPSRACDLTALAVDADHIRQRLYWVATSDAYRVPEVGPSVPRPKSVPWASGAGIPRLADGLSGDLVRSCVSGFGNAIVPDLAIEVVAAFLEAEADERAGVGALELIG